MTASERRGRAMGEQLDFLDAQQPEAPPAVPITLAVACLRESLRATDGEVDRIALRMGIDALEKLANVRVWVRGFGQKYTGEELAALADLVEEIGGKSDEV